MADSIQAQACSRPASWLSLKRGGCQDVFQGRFEHGVMHGHGAVEYAGGGRYLGGWVRGCKEGTGKYTYRSGVRAPSPAPASG